MFERRATVRCLIAVTLFTILLILPPRVDAQDKSIPVTGLADGDLEPFDDMMLAFMRDNEVPGAALAVAKDGRLVYARGFGYADSDAMTPVSPRALFRIASISKPITAAAILRLVEMGKLRLDDAAFELLKLAPPAGAEPDSRLKQI